MTKEDLYKKYLMDYNTATLYGNDTHKYEIAKFMLDKGLIDLHPSSNILEVGGNNLFAHRGKDNYLLFPSVSITNKELTNFYDYETKKHIYDDKRHIVSNANLKPNGKRIISLQKDREELLNNIDVNTHFKAIISMGSINSIDELKGIFNTNLPIYIADYYNKMYPIGKGNLSNFGLQLNEELAYYIQKLYLGDRDSSIKYYEESVNFGESPDNKTTLKLIKREIR